MKAYSILILVSLWCSLPAFGQFHYKGLQQGLEVKEYPRTETQTNEGAAFAEREALGDPIGEAYLIPNLVDWKYTTERNAVAEGRIRIIKAGKYHFMSNSFYDRNVLTINGEVVCGFRDGETTVGTIKLKAGLIPIASIGYVDGRGGTEGVVVKWKPPGQREFSEIPPHILLHQPRPNLMLREKDQPVVLRAALPKPKPSNLRANSMTVVAKDFVIEVYHNGKRIPQEQRKLLLDRFGATAERITAEVKPGDWLVYHVANNRLRHERAKYFAVVGALDEVGPTFVSDLKSENWSVCDSPRNSGWFISERKFGTEARAVAVENPWNEGQKFIEEYSGYPFSGDAIWGAASSTWIKYIVPEKADSLSAVIKGDIEELEITDDEHEVDSKEPELAILEPRRYPVQVISAIYGTGGKNADVTDRVKEYVEEKREFFAANPKYLGVDPNPHWNKGLRIVYQKDGVRRTQRRNENEHILPESFYGPHDAAELSRWIIGTRWQGLRGEIQFHPNGIIAGSDLTGDAQWKPLDARRIEIVWADKKSEVFSFDHKWSGFKIPDDGQNGYRIMR